MPPEMHAPTGRPACRRPSVWPAIMALTLIFACAPTMRQPLPPALAPGAGTELLARLEAINHDLHAFKGIGRLDLDTANGRQTARMAWAGVLPDRLRLDIMGAGLPAVSLSSDGRRTYLRENGSGRIRSQATRDASLEPILGLPVKVADVLQAMAGRLPDTPHDAISAHQGQAANEALLVFQRKWRGPSARVILAVDGSQLRRVEFLASDGTLRYRIVYRDHRYVGPYRLPRTVEISDDAVTCTVRMDRVWTDVALSDETFVLTPPDR